jgi:hypothetical protein
MDLELAGVAERLAVEFADLPSAVVIEAVCTCASECASAGPMFIEQAARANLCSAQSAYRESVVPAQPGPRHVADAVGSLVDAQTWRRDWTIRNLEAT